QQNQSQQGQQWPLSRAQELYLHKRFSVDEQALDEFDDDDNESKELLSPGTSSSSSSSSSRASKRIDNVALIC
ncbi:Transmembrane protein, partial [Globisporangium polare]